MLQLDARSSSALSNMAEQAAATAADTFHIHGQMDALAYAVSQVGKGGGGGCCARVWVWDPTPHPGWGATPDAECVSHNHVARSSSQSNACCISPAWLHSMTSHS
jgi:hypothetical protein